jgi:Tol biopolymer transport system component
MTRRTIVALSLVTAAVVALWSLEAPAAKGGKPKPPPEPADPAIAYIVPWTQIWVMDADGENQTKIHENASTGWFYCVSWAPDGQHLAYSNYYELWRLDVDVVDGVPRASNATRLFADPDRRVDGVDWSPDGDEILFCTRRASPDGPGTVADIRTVPAAGGTATVVYVSPDGRVVGNSCWSSDAKRIAFTEGTGGLGPAFRVLTLATGDVRTVLTGWQNGLDGTRAIAYARTKDVIAIQGGNETTGGKVYTLDLGTGVVTEHFAGSGSVAWSPDDSRLVFHGLGRKYGFEEGLWTYEFATGSTKQLAKKSGSGYGRWPDWRR